ncbi:MAG: zinc ribbon domain-containing protein [Thermoleophilaceae bacterium]
MPVYEYRCENGHNFEVLQRMSDGAVTECTVCGAPVQRVFHPIAVHFKGSGFYNTDYGKQKRGNSSSSSDEGTKPSDNGKAPEKSADKKAEKPAPSTASKSAD